MAAEQTASDLGLRVSASEASYESFCVSAIGLSGLRLAGFRVCGLRSLV